LPCHEVTFLPPHSCEVRTNEVTQTIIVPPVGIAFGVSSVSVIGVASDGSGMTTFLYFRPFPEDATTIIGLHTQKLLLAGTLLKLMNGNGTETVSANGDQWLADGISCDIRNTVSGRLSCMESNILAVTGSVTVTRTTTFFEPVSSFHFIMEATAS
jgi:hypothetical protein